MMKRMILVEPSKLRTSVLPDSLEEKVSSLEDEINNILHNTTMNDFEKSSAYQRALHDYLTRVKQLQVRKISSLPISEKNKSISPHLEDNKETEHSEKLIKLESRLLNSLPKSLQNKGKLLIDYIKDETDLKWNGRGELLIKDEVMKDSNVSDLIHEVLRTRKLSTTPKGWNVFTKLLKDSNIPMDFIGNKMRWEQSNEVKDKSDSKETGTLHQSYFNEYTPKRGGVKKRKKARSYLNWLSYNSA